MKSVLLLLILISLIPATISVATPVSPNGIPLFENYRNWELVAPSYREDKQHIRVILGNPLAVKALRTNTRPLPDGAILAKVAWTVRKHPSFPVATVPGDFVQVEFMMKNAALFKETGGWGFARFIGKDYQPYGKDAGFVTECFNCHKPVQTNDYLFTTYAPNP